MTAGPPGPLAQLCRETVSATGVSSCGVTMVVDGGQSVTAHATDGTARAVEEMQHTLGEGPGVEASSSGSTVLVPNLRDDSQPDLRRWPTFAHEAVGAGVQAVFAFPLVLGTALVGALSLYRDSPGALSSVQLSLSLVGADSVARALAHSGDGLPATSELDDPMRVHQAAGMVMVQLSVPIDQALLRMRAVAFAEGSTVDTLAADIVERRRRLTEEKK